MAKILILEFPAIDDAKYSAVNAKLGIDMKSGKGNWPAGMRSHSAARTAEGGFFVIEVWDSEGQQDQFMKTRLGAALQEVGVQPPRRVVWADLLTNHLIA
jgi:hypothetical protein